MKAEELARWVRAEHEKVGELMERLEDRVNCVPKANQGQWLDEVRKDFGHFRAHITKHMALEEQDGYMSQSQLRHPILDAPRPRGYPISIR